MSLITAKCLASAAEHVRARFRPATAAHVARALEKLHQLRAEPLSISAALHPDS